MPDDPVTTTAILRKIRAARAQFDALIAEVGEARMLIPGVAGDWTAKDVIAHVTWHEREMIGLLRKRALAGSEWWGLPLDERNANIYAANKDRTLPDVLAEARQNYAEMIALLEKVTDEEWNDPACWSDFPPDVMAWQIVAQNTDEHYEEHLPDLRRFLASHSRQPARLPPVPGILQARTLEWVATAFSDAWKGKGKGKSLGRVRLFPTPWTAAYRAPPPMGVSRREDWSGLPWPERKRICPLLSC